MTTKTPRELRDRLEVLTTELADAKELLAKRSSTRAARVAQLELQLAALHEQHASLKRLLSLKRDAVEAVTERVAQARRENPVPQVPPPPDADTPDFGLLYLLFGQTPDYAQNRGAWSRFRARLDLVLRR